MKIAGKMIGLLAVLIIAGECSNKKETAFNDGLNLYNQNKLEEALPFFKMASEQGSATAETYAYLAETYRRLGEREKALLADGEALRDDSCNSFAHVTLSYIYNPMYGNWEGADRTKSWEHILKGIECDSTDGNVWLAAWTEAIYNHDEEIEKKSLNMMIQTNFFTPAILAFDRWMLKDLPENAILLTNGDMDTYPAVALQEAEDFRKDVVVMNYSLLNTRWYQDHIQDTYNFKFPFSAAELDSLKPVQDESGEIKTVASQIMARLIEVKTNNNFDRPIAISITVADSGFARGYENHFVLEGSFKLWTENPSDNGYDLDAIGKCLEGLDLPEFSGPYAGEADRSPVRKVTAKKVADNFMYLAILYIDQEKQLNNLVKARAMLQWAQNANSRVMKNPEADKQLRSLEESLGNGDS